MVRSDFITTVIFIPTFNDEQISQLLNDSDFMDSDDEDVFIPEPDQESNSDSSSSSESEDGEAEVAVRERGRGRGRAQSARGQRGGRSRGRSTSTRARRVQSARGRSESSSPGFEVPDPIIRYAEWYKNNEMQFSNSPLMQPDCLPMSIDESYYNKFTFIDNYISEEIFMLITEKSNQTFLQRNGKTLDLTLKETKVFLE